MSGAGLSNGNRELRGRDREIAQLRDLLNGPPALHLVLGDQGVGKTALVSHIASPLKTDPMWTVFAYSADLQRDERFPFKRGGWMSLGNLVDGVEKDLADATAGLPPLSDIASADGIEESLRTLAAAGRRVLLILDGIENLITDPPAADRLTRIANNLPHGCHILITARGMIVFSYPDLTIEPIYIEGLSLSAFSELLRDNGIQGNPEQISHLHRLTGGLPLVASVVRRRGRNLDEVDYQYVALGVERQLVSSFKTRMQQLQEPARTWVDESVKMLAVSREPVPLSDILRLLPTRPANLRLLWDTLSKSRMLDLCLFDGRRDFAAQKLRLRNVALLDALQSDYFEQDLSAVHRRLAEAMADAGTPFDRRNLLYHTLEGFNDKELAAHVQSTNRDWAELLHQSLKDDWSSTDNFLPWDLVRLLKALNGRVRETVARQFNGFGRDRADWRTDSSMDTLRLEELRSTVEMCSRPREHRPRLRLALDLWPGYFPFLAMERELNQCGIAFEMVQSSSLKLDLLRDRQFDLIASAAGCLSGVPPTILRRLHAVGVLNRSWGNDHILTDSRSLEISNGKVKVIDSKPRRLRALAVKGSTSHLFLLWFLRRNEIDQDRVDFEYIRDYPSLYKRAMDSDINLISTWEPFASLAMHGRPLRSIFNSSEGPGIIFDFLIAERERSNAPEFRELMSKLWALYDRCISEKLYSDPQVLERVVGRYQLNRETYARWIEGIKFFGAEERRQFYEGSQEDSFEKVMDRVADTWATAADGPAATLNLAAWKEDLRAVGSGFSAWLMAGPAHESRASSELNLAQLATNIEDLLHQANRCAKSLGLELYRPSTEAYRDLFEERLRTPVTTAGEFSLLIIRLYVVFDESLPGPIRRGTDSSPVGQELHRIFDGEPYRDMNGLRQFAAHVKEQRDIETILDKYTGHTWLRDDDAAGWSQLQYQLMRSLATVLELVVRALMEWPSGSGAAHQRAGGGGSDGPAGGLG